MIRFVFIDSGVNLKVRGLTGTWGGSSTVHGVLCMVSEGLSLSQQTFLIFLMNVQKQDQCDLDLDLGLHRERSKSCTTSLAFYLVNLFV